MSVDLGEGREGEGGAASELAPRELEGARSLTISGGAARARTYLCEIHSYSDYIPESREGPERV